MKQTCICVECGDEFTDTLKEPTSNVPPKPGYGGRRGGRRVTRGNIRCPTCRTGMHGVTDVVSYMEWLETRAREGRWSARRRTEDDA